MPGVVSRGPRGMCRSVANIDDTRKCPCGSRHRQTRHVPGTGRGSGRHVTCLAPDVWRRDRVRPLERRSSNNAAVAGRILWDVDTQVDFMEPSGKLYVPGAKDVAHAMELLVDAARAARIVHVASADDHELTDPEISDSPDLRSTFPPHCLRGTRGAEKIIER